MQEAKALLPKKIVYIDDIYEALNDADAVVLMTEWNQYRGLDLDDVKKVWKAFIDLRNVYEPGAMIEHGFMYTCVGCWS